MAVAVPRWRRPSVLPGFGLTLGYTLTYLGVIVLLPLAGLLLRPLDMGWQEFWALATSPRVLAALRLSFGAALIAALVDLPFALPTAVAGIALTALYAPNGWLGAPLDRLGVTVAFTPLGVVMALIFIGIPFVVRTVQPVLQDVDREVEEAAATLGASRLQAFLLVILPLVTPALLTGFALAFARGVGEYGSIIFIAGNMPMVSEIAPLLIVIKLEQFDYAGAAAIGVIMLIVSFMMLLAINLIQRRSRAWGVP